MTTFRAEDRIDPPTAAGEAPTLTLGGPLKHLAVVEAGWLNQFFAAALPGPPGSTSWTRRTRTGP